MATDLGSRLDRGITLPFDWFCDPEIFRLEQRRVFADSWLYAGVADWVAEPGQFFTTRAGLVPIVVVRDEDGNLNAFVNICRHRATEVAEGAAGGCRCSVPTTPGPTGSTAVCAPRRAASSSRGSTGRTSGSCRSPSTPGGRSSS